MSKKPEKLPKLRRFIIRKYVMATNAIEALKKEKDTIPDDCWLDDKYQDDKFEPASAIGFQVYNEYNED